LALPAPWWFLVDLRSRFGRRVQLLQVYRSGSTRSVFIELRPCQHDNGYMDGRSQIKVHTHSSTPLYIPLFMMGYSDSIKCYDIFEE